MTYLKRNVIKLMMNQGKLKSAGFSKVTNSFQGYKLVPKKAFQSVDPEIVRSLDPNPFAKQKEESLTDF
eukprot:CAMPEP_0114583950 /NCGR_PEP_ID=MMETSP0125-20121206/7631_1 /TAXON_ID=485358 ORGANISM="Aristerostoma sp., Strain ATCC 50986" /NCGR_SAMPLE_ID=MMETSP0125 /ASSEMBLY_ACC=CAM_ASM_000245 /LENGTH=68 /DNA_ID=CAMNT_0001777815 /DNA_START=209 /DNA_END=415 /DNA_ORIENTATION=+